jgi:transcriptional regulator with XRE-family HTH domain
MPSSAAAKQTPGVWFAEGLEDLMQERGVTYRELAAATGFSPGYLNRIVTGTRPVPSDAAIKVIARAVRVRPDHFLEYRARRLQEVLDRRPQLIDDLYDQYARR